MPSHPTSHPPPPPDDGPVEGRQALRRDASRRQRTPVGSHVQAGCRAGAKQNKYID